ncbi:putative flavin-containing monooxygenase 1 [Platanthera guangdongensis]|uniref:Flavin-containing monooxygenase 1 n=1 Tax=Platanthera guangdongensis TaxID=2320717 RepID=A0ABR2MBN8_9ASPA
MNFVILCIGRSSGLPKIPTFPKNEGPEIFNGKVIHSMDYSNMDSTAAAELIKGKRIVIIGYLKSALDLASDCADINEVDLLKVCGKLLNENTSPQKAWDDTRVQFLRGIIVGLYDAFPENFYDKVEDGRIILKPSKTFKFCKFGVLAEGEAKPIEADLVIYGTGFNGDQKIRDIFVSPRFQTIVARTDAIIPLYRYNTTQRECIHPQIPQLGIIGYSDSISNLYTSEMKARWLACFLDDGFILPSRKDMEKNISEWDKFFKKYSGSSSRYYRRSCINSVHTWYNDQLCKDMGCNPRRKKGFFTDLFIPYGPSDYAT